MNCDVNSVNLRIGYFCNNNCSYCMIDENKKKLLKQDKPIFLTFDKIKLQLNDLIKKKLKSITLTGGEPTIRDDFFEILYFLKQNNFVVELETNGRMFADTTFAKKTINIFPDLYFEISLLSTIPESHDMLTRVSNSWKQTTTGIKNLIKLGVTEFNIIVVITKQNYKDIKNIPQYLKSLGDVKWTIGYTFPMIQGNAKLHSVLIIPKYEQIQKYLFESIKNALNLGINFNLFNMPFCVIEDYIKYSVEFNNNLAHTDLLLYELEDSISTWNKERINSKIKCISCKSCKYFRLCEGVWNRYIKMYGVDELVPIKGKQINTLL
ncbi:MAG: radical SAM protein [DPANN group archaeon]|nr:radical SAM protein [DPANN group archaeon]